MQKRLNRQARRVAAAKGIDTDSATREEIAELYKPRNVLAGYLTPDELATELDVCTKTLDRWRVFGEGPPITKVGRKVYYKRDGVITWLQTREK
jgi:hypothetical protein